MNPSDVLMSEHRVIEQVLRCLDEIVKQGESQGAIDRDNALSAIEFFQHFADHCHHGKEETHFFTWMEDHGFPRDGGPTGVMLYEHEQGRERIQGMLSALDRAAEGEAKAVAVFAVNARAYIGLLSEHIQKEDHCLFPMAENRMSEAERNEMLERFRKTEREHEDGHAHARYLQIADRLAERYQVERANVSPEWFAIYESARA